MTNAFPYLGLLSVSLYTGNGSSFIATINGKFSVISRI